MRFVVQLHQNESVKTARIARRRSIENAFVHRATFMLLLALAVGLQEVYLPSRLPSSTAGFSTCNRCRLLEMSLYEDGQGRRRKGFVARRAYDAHQDITDRNPRQEGIKQYHPKKKGNKERASAVTPPISPEEHLTNAKAALAAAAEEVGVEFVGCVVRASRTLAFKIWIDQECGVEGELLGKASAALRDALWEAVPGRPAISVQTPGRTRPLFSADDFERFRTLRAQVTLREPMADGRKRLLGEIIGVERRAAPFYHGSERAIGDQSGDPGPEQVFVVVHDESADAPVSAPLSAIQFGEKTALAPRNAQSGPLALAKPKRGGKTVGEAEARAFVDAELKQAPIVVFLKSYCPHCRRALKVLRDCGVAAGDPRLHLVQLENREDMVAVQQHLRLRTGASTVPRIFIGEEAIGGADDLEALAQSKGFLEARLMIASSEFAERAERSARVDQAIRRAV